MPVSVPGPLPLDNAHAVIYHCHMTTTKSTPPATTPMCDEARKIDTLKARVRHYRTCQDERCQERARVTNELSAAIAKGAL